MDMYGTQRVLEFLRQLLDLMGFWHPHRREWIQLEMIWLAGVCCPPASFGRVKLSSRFLRHAGVLCVEHPSREATQVVVRGLLSDSCSMAEASPILTDFCFAFRDHFRASDRAHYVANLRDLTD